MILFCSLAASNRTTLQNFNVADMHQNTLKITYIWYLFGTWAILEKFQFWK